MRLRNVRSRSGPSPGTSHRTASAGSAARRSGKRRSAAADHRRRRRQRAAVGSVDRARRRVRSRVRGRSLARLRCWQGRRLQRRPRRRSRRDVRPREERASGGLLLEDGRRHLRAVMARWARHVAVSWRRRGLRFRADYRAGIHPDCPSAMSGRRLSSASGMHPRRGLLRDRRDPRFARASVSSATSNNAARSTRSGDGWNARRRIPFGALRRAPSARAHCSPGPVLVPSGRGSLRARC